MTEHDKVVRIIAGLEWMEKSHIGIEGKIARETIALLKAQEPHVLTLEEVKRFVYGMPYIIETNLPREEPHLMYGLYSHQGVSGCLYFAFTDARSHFFDADYGKTWRCWTSRPTDEQRKEAKWIASTRKEP